MLHASAYSHKGRLCIIGVYETPWGAIPFAHHCMLATDVPDGPIRVDKEMHPKVREALDKSQDVIMSKIKNETMSVAAENLVERARQGDQNAMAMLMMIRQAAQAGKPRAKIAYDILRVYIKDHPSVGTPRQLPKPQRRSQAEVFQAVKKAVQTNNPLHYGTAIVSLVPSSGTTVEDATVMGTILANGPPLTRARIQAILGALEDPGSRRILTTAIRLSDKLGDLLKLSKQLPPEGRRALRIGYSLGLAQRLQQVRLPETPMSVYSQMVAWELGE
jgi:hypothetical protein